jgi:hypothetical protein
VQFLPLYKINKGEVFKCSMDLHLGQGLGQKLYMRQKPAIKSDNSTNCMAKDK